MSIAAPAPITALPTPPSTADIVNFDLRADAFNGALPSFRTEANAVATNVYENALQVKANAESVAANTATTAINANLAANYAGAAAWVSGSYAMDAVVRSTINRRLYYKCTSTAEEMTIDPSLDPTNWTGVNSETPKQLINTAVTQAVAGGAYALTNSTPQAAATNLIRFSNAIDNAAWDRIGTASVIANTDWDYEGKLTADSLIIPTLGDRVICSSFPIAGSTNYAISVWLRGSGVIYVGYSIGGGASQYKSTAITLTPTLTRYTILVTTVPGSTSMTVIIGTYDVSVGPAGTATGAYIAGVQCETGSVATSNIVTGATAFTRPAGLIAPQRILLPPAPKPNDCVNIVSANGSAENVVDPNGQQFYGPSGPLYGSMRLDSRAAAVNLQFINNFWRVI